MGACAGPLGYTWTWWPAGPGYNSGKQGRAFRATGAAWSLGSGTAGQADSPFSAYQVFFVRVRRPACLVEPTGGRRLESWIGKELVRWAGAGVSRCRCASSSLGWHCWPGRFARLCLIGLGAGAFGVRGKVWFILSFILKRSGLNRTAERGFRSEAQRAIFSSSFTSLSQGARGGCCARCGERRRGGKMVDHDGLDGCLPLSPSSLGCK